MWILFFASFVASANAIAELSCTANGAYTEQSTACDDEYPTVCPNMFKDSKVKPGATDERPDACFKATGGTDPDKGVIDFAAKNCAKTCGFCCLTEKYKCSNKPPYQSRFDCSKVTKIQCNAPAYRAILAEDCPATCGLCLEGGCVDSVPDCDADIRICLTMPDFAQNECKRTCGNCNAATTVKQPTTVPPTAAPSATTRAPSNTCADKSSSCRSWAGNDFCSNTWYSFDYRKSTCGKTCGFC